MFYLGQGQNQINAPQSLQDAFGRLFCCRQAATLAGRVAGLLTLEGKMKEGWWIGNGKSLWDCTRFFMLATLLASLLIAAFLWLAIPAAKADEIGTASYYTVASCLREGTSGIMANGKALKDESFICASWAYRFGTRLRVTNLDNGKSVVVVVSDRGPSKRLVKKGRVIDLSKAAFLALSPLSKGIIKVRVENV